MTARLWAWPAVSAALTPPGVALYLTWPAWQQYRLNELGEQDHPLMSPVFTPDPPNFLASLKNLLALTQEGGTGQTTIPFHCPEVATISEDLHGYSSSGHSSPGQSSPTQSLTPPGPEPLILALGHLAQERSRRADLLVKKALAQKADLLALLKDEPLEANGEERLAEPANLSDKLAKAWLTLARPHLRNGDLLWPIYGVEPEFAPAPGLALNESGWFIWSSG
ncbi:MAG: hypothetical protein LBT86_09280 [Deltaproteobacteria bacterium]|jgi:hypothetical protein|nr:hypothetical protein [Deltaproteobacteria bacterium]